MPELPEVETVKEGLKSLLEGYRLKSIALHRADLRTPFPQGFEAGFKGAQIVGLRRRAKYILADLDTGYVWLTHLGMSGSFRRLKGQREPHDHVTITRADGLKLVYNDPRRFGQMDLFLKDQEADHPALKNLGAEPLDKKFTGAVLLRALARKTIAIKPALLDQRVVAGVGNIYASEALFYAGISPYQPAYSLGASACDRLAQAIKKVLKAAIASGGSTLRDHRTLEGDTGYFQHNFGVYDREGERCPGCTCTGKPGIESVVQAGRSTYFCGQRQPLIKKGA